MKLVLKRLDRNFGLYKWTSPHFQLSSRNVGKIRICSFDFDGTLINAKRRGKGSDDPLQYTLAHPTVLKRLGELASERNSLVVIFTNQGGIEKGKATVEFVQKRIANFISKVHTRCVTNFFNVAVCVSASMKDHFRKPMTGMWDYVANFVEENGASIDLEASFYIGDAAGRKKTSNHKKDFSDSDRKFAHNVGLKFLTPQSYFENKVDDSEWEWKGFDPTTFQTEPNFADLNQTLDDIFNDVQIPPRMIVLCGTPTCGKTTFAGRLARYLRKTDKFKTPECFVIHRDSTTTTTKAKTKCQKLMELGKCIIVDNCNGSVNSRKKYLEICAKLNLPETFVWCIHLDVPKPLAIHLGSLRAQLSKMPVKLNDVAYHASYKRFKSPTIREGFDRVVKLPFIPNFGENSELQNIFNFRF